jgi:hypothetical protein
MLIELEEERMTEAMKVVLNHNPEKVLKYSMKSALMGNQNSLLFDKSTKSGFHQSRDIKLENYNKKVHPLKYPFI